MTTEVTIPTSGGIHHVFITVKDLRRSRPFYAQLMPRLGYPGVWEFDGGGESVGFLGAGGSFWVKQGDPRFAADTFCKDRVGPLRDRLPRRDARPGRCLGARHRRLGGAILDAPREYPEYVPGYYAVFFADPDGIKFGARLSARMKINHGLHGFHGCDPSRIREIRVIRGPCASSRRPAMSIAEASSGPVACRGWISIPGPSVTRRRGRWSSIGALGGRAWTRCARRSRAVVPELVRPAVIPPLWRFTKPAH
jgi:catechol 2,3-dioxygenase-like lactoylglutathione lyase family enzyme